MINIIRTTYTINKIIFLIALFLITLQFNAPLKAEEYINRTLFTAKTEGRNIKEAIANAKKILIKEIQKKIPNQLNANIGNLLIDNNNLTIRNLGRSKNGKNNKVIVSISTKNYFQILDNLLEKINQKLKDTDNWQAQSAHEFNKQLNMLDELISLNIAASVENIQQKYRYRYLEIKEDYQQLRYRATLDFIGETQGITLYINDVPHKNTHKIKNLIPGKHYFKISKKGYIDIIGSVFLNPGEHRKYFISLIRKQNQPIKINVILGSLLEEHKEYIEQTLRRLGFQPEMSEEEQSETSLDMMLDLDISNRNPKGGRLSQKTYKVSVHIRQEAEFLFRQHWHKVQNFPKKASDIANKKAPSFIQELIQQGLYEARYNH